MPLKRLSGKSLEVDSSRQRVLLSGLGTALAALSGYTKLTETAPPGAMSLTVNELPAGLAETGGWALIDPWTLECEIRRITSRIDDTVIVSSALAYQHDPNDQVFWLDDGVVNMLWFGPVGDGETDNSLNLQRSFDQLQSNMTWTLPNGDFLITSTGRLVGKSHVKLLGLGGRLINTGCTAIEIDDVDADVENVMIQDLIIAGPPGGTGSSVDPPAGIDFIGTNRATRRCLIKENYIGGNKVGIRVRSGSAGHRIYNNNLVTTDINESIGILIEEADCKTRDNVIRGFHTGISLSAGSQICTGNHIFMSPSAVHYADIAIRRGQTGYANGFTISGNYLDGSPQDGFLVINCQAARNISVDDNYFRVVGGVAGPLIRLENGGSIVDVQNLSVTNSHCVNVSGTVKDAIEFSGVQNDGSINFHVFSNSWAASNVTHYYTQGGYQTDSYSGGATYTPDPSLGRTLELTIGSDTTIGAPASNLDGGIGNRMTFVIIQNGTGGHIVNWFANYLEGWTDTGNTADKRSSITFEWNGVNWIQIGAQSPYVD